MDTCRECSKKHGSGGSWDNFCSETCENAHAALAVSLSQSLLSGLSERQIKLLNALLVSETSAMVLKNMAEERNAQLGSSETQAEYVNRVGFEAAAYIRKGPYNPQWLHSYRAA